MESDGSEGRGDAPLGIREEVEREPVPLAKGDMGGFVLGAHPEDHRAKISEGL
jgi:hypothetical protein